MELLTRVVAFTGRAAHRCWTAGRGIYWPKHQVGFNTQFGPNCCARVGQVTPVGAAKGSPRTHLSEGDIQCKHHIRIIAYLDSAATEEKGPARLHACCWPPRTYALAERTQGRRRKIAPRGPTGVISTANHPTMDERGREWGATTQMTWARAVYGRRLTTRR
jgi:hypothetical protein